MPTLKHPKSGRPLTVTDTAYYSPETGKVIVERLWLPAVEDVFADGWQGVAFKTPKDPRQFARDGGGLVTFGVTTGVPDPIASTLPNLTQDEVDQCYASRTIFEDE